MWTAFLNRALTNWKTTVTGFLSTTLIVSGVLAQQGVSFGTIGKGSGVALIGAMATALLGLLAKD